MPARTLIATILIAASPLSLGAAAQNVYKCGAAYSQQPCPGGNAVAAGDPRSAEQKAQAGAAARRDARLADSLEKDRLRQDAQAAPAHVTPLPTAMQERNAEVSRPRQLEVFKAVAPAKPGDKAAKPPKKKKKAKKKDAA
jgi:hypothetical protein